MNVTNSDNKSGELLNQLSLEADALESQIEFVKSLIALWQLEHDLCPGCPGPGEGSLNDILSSVSRSRSDLGSAIQVAATAVVTSKLGPLDR